MNYAVTTSAVLEGSKYTLEFYDKSVHDALAQVVHLSSEINSGLSCQEIVLLILRMQPLWDKSHYLSIQFFDQVRL
jgi:hypothetical protein